jgi:hypothetical protein
MTTNSPTNTNQASEEHLNNDKDLKQKLMALKTTNKALELGKLLSQLTTQARIDELEQLWNSTQPDIVPDGIPANDMSEALHKRIEKLRSEL